VAAGPCSSAAPASMPRACAASTAARGSGCCKNGYRRNKLGAIWGSSTMTGGPVAQGAGTSWNR
jgi:hypothetical protein